MAETVQGMNASVQEVVRSLEPPDAILVGPRHLRAESRRFAETARGEMIWFNVCFTMFRSQDVFDLMLRPAIENSHVTSIQFISNEGERELWNQNLLPKIKECQGSEKVGEPRWRQLPETVSFILADTPAIRSNGSLVELLGRTVHVTHHWKAGASLHLPHSRAFRFGSSIRRTRTTTSDVR